MVLCKKGIARALVIVFQRRKLPITLKSNDHALIFKPDNTCSYLKSHES